MPFEPRTYLVASVPVTLEGASGRLVFNKLKKFHCCGCSMSILYVGSEEKSAMALHFS